MSKDQSFLVSEMSTAPECRHRMKMYGCNWTSTNVKKLQALSVLRGDVESLQEISTGRRRIGYKEELFLITICAPGTSKY